MSTRGCGVLSSPINQTTKTIALPATDNRTRADPTPQVGVLLTATKRIVSQIASSTMPLTSIGPPARCPFSGTHAIARARAAITAQSGIQKSPW
jgi:hypothetical protein